MRSVIVIVSVLMCLFCLSCTGGRSCLAEPPSGEYVTGYVFEDTNENGIMDDGERGIAGVLVSNQREVVRTDKKGRYYLPVEDNMTIFVVKPANYQLPLSNENLPQFYYHHYPEGSPDGLKFPGIELTGDLPEHVNFPLIAGDDPDELEVMFIGDPQPQTHRELDYMRDGFVSEIREEGYSFALALGDLIYDELDLFPRYNRIMGHLGMPVYNVIGNHDLDYNGDKVHAKDNYRSHFGPNFYAFTYGNVHFFSVDNIEVVGNTYRGAIRERQLEWIENMLKHISKDDWLVFGSHIPLYTPHSASQRLNTIDREQLFTLLQDRPNVLTLAAHTHTNEYNFLGPDQGWINEEPLVHIVCGAICGAWWGGFELPDGFPYNLQPDGVPAGYFTVRFDGDKKQARFVPLSKDPDYQIRVSSPRGAISRDELSQKALVVNVFMGSRKTEVSAVIDGRKIALEQTVRTDPFMEKVLEEYRDKYRGWITLNRTEHIWEGKMPDNLEPGAYSIEIEARLHDGRVFRERQVIEIIE